MTRVLRGDGGAQLVAVAVRDPFGFTPSSSQVTSSSKSLAVNVLLPTVSFVGSSAGSVSTSSKPGRAVKISRSPPNHIS